MQHTVESILTEIYGSEAEGAERLAVGRSAVCNWKAWGYFPDRLLAKIVSDAAAAGKNITLDDVHGLRRHAGAA